MESKEQKIIEAAFRLFHQHGYKKVTMCEIADAAEMSRPTLYAAFPNKEAVFSALAEQHRERAELDTKEQLPRAKTLEDRLACLFEIWIIAPFASVIDSPSGLDLLGNAESYAPEAVAKMYARFEQHLITALKSEMPLRRGMASRDLAHVVMLATKGLKASTTTLAELRRMTDGLIAMAVATTRASQSDGGGRSSGLKPQAK